MTSGITSTQNSQVWATNAIGSSTPFNFIPPNPNRKTLTFTNPAPSGTGNDVLVAPLAAFQVTSSGVFPTASAPLTISAANPGGARRVFVGGGSVVVSGLAAKLGWVALAVAGSNNPLTAEEDT
ncbi:MAG TPA: hypothetical protein VF748_17695 [Candidatus Acidoferrum sp.]